MPLEWLAEFSAWHFQWDLATVRAQPAWLMWRLYREHERRIDDEAER